MLVVACNEPDRRDRVDGCTQEQQVTVLQLFSEAAHEQLQRAFGLEIDPGLCAFWACRWSASPQARACWHGAALAAGLREHFDVDWYRNPRAAEAIEAVCSDETLAADLAERGRERAGKFTWQACAAGVLDVYREVI